MTPAQVQFQLYGCPSWLAGLDGALSAHRSLPSLAGPVAPASLSHALGVLRPRRVGADFLDHFDTFLHGHPPV